MESADLEWFDAPATVRCKAHAAHDTRTPAPGEVPPVLLLAAEDGRLAEIAAQVRDAGFSARIARPGTATLREAVLAPPTLVIVDVEGDDAAPLRTVDRIRRSLGALTPYVLAIVEGDETSYERAFVYGARDVLSRPVAPSLLRVKVARHARNSAPPATVVGGCSVRGVLGRGGMGTVYLAERPGMDGPVALKVLGDGVSAIEAEALARFRREWEALRAAGGCGVPRFLDAGRDGDTFYYLMEYIPGETLAQSLARGPLDEAELVPVVRDVAAALEQIHEIGLVHRDVKPANVILAPRGARGPASAAARLVDFGLAKTRGDHALTKAQDVLGTVAYMAPELIRGEPIDTGVDAFALGMTALEAALGRLPVDGSSYAIASRRASGVVARASVCGAGVLSSEVASVLDGLLAPDARERLSAREARARLAAWDAAGGRS
jgi:CheY-like chemotaxis protein